MNDPFESLVQAGLQAGGAEDFAAALDAWEQAARVRPASPIPHFLRGAELAQAGRIDEAEAAYANAVLLAPGFETARYQLGLLQFTSGRAALAQVTWEPLFSLAEGHAIRSFVLGFSALARDDFAIAIACFRDGMAANHDNPPMNDDIARVIAAIDGLGKTTAAQASKDGHVLLASYRQHSALN